MITENLDPKEAFKKLSKPTKQSNYSCKLVNETLAYDNSYKQFETDPLERISNIKNEIVSLKKAIDDYAEQVTQTLIKFSNNEFVKEGDNLPQVFQDLEVYKSKIDAFVNYELLADQTDNDSEKSDNESEKSAKKQEFHSLFEKYHRMTENLISQVKVRVYKIS